MHARTHARTRTRTYINKCYIKNSFDIIIRIYRMYRIKLHKTEYKIVKSL